MNLLLLGATGYLGKHLLPKLLIGNNITIICRKPHLVNTSDNLTILGNNENEIIEYFSNMKSKEQVFDWIINLSCSYMYNGNYKAWQGNYEFPARIACMLQEYCLFASVITIGTGLPYAFNLYSFCKKQFFDLCCFLNDLNSNKYNVINIKLENLYGEDDPIHRFLPSAIKKLLHNEDIELTEGYQHRDFIYIEDVINALLFILSYYSGKSVNKLEIPLGTGEAPSIRELVQYCKEIANSKSKLLFGAIPLRNNEPDSIANIDKLREIGFTHKYSWKEGLRLMIMRLK